jgi:hypothetical protein
MRLLKNVMAATASVLLATSSFAQSSGDTLSPLVQVLGQSEDAQLQLDILKGISDGLKGQSRVSMPKGWDAAAKKLAQSAGADAQSLAHLRQFYCAR